MADQDNSARQLRVLEQISDGIDTLEMHLRSVAEHLSELSELHRTVDSIDRRLSNIEDSYLEP